MESRSRSEMGVQLKGNDSDQILSVMVSYSHNYNLYYFISSGHMYCTVTFVIHKYQLGALSERLQKPLLMSEIRQSSASATLSFTSNGIL
jgi:hypothetical protein